MKGLQWVLRIRVRPCLSFLSAPWEEREVCLHAVRTSRRAPANWRDAAGWRRCLPRSERQARPELPEQRRLRKRRDQVGSRQRTPLLLPRRHSPNPTPHQWIRRRRTRPRRAWLGDKRSALRGGPWVVPVPPRPRQASRGIRQRKTSRLPEMPTRPSSVNETWELPPSFRNAGDCRTVFAALFAPYPISLGNCKIQVAGFLYPSRGISTHKPLSRPRMDTKTHE